MAQARHDRPALVDPRGDVGFSEPIERASLPSLQAGEMLLDFQHGVVTAQKIAVYRDDQRIMAKLKTLAARSGEKYWYSWEANDRANQRKQTVEGPTIKLANDLAREYGNCIVDVRAIDIGDAFMIYARFTDLETGFSMTRPFQQRKGQNTGMRDGGRALDAIFQIGVSKAIRNVVVNSLSNYAEFMVEEAKKALVDWVENHPEKAISYIEGAVKTLGIDVKRVEAVVGRIFKDWTVRDKARVMSELRGIEEGLTVADEVYPTTEAAATVTAEKTEKKVDGLKRETPPTEESATTTAGSEAKPAPASEAPPAATAASVPQSETASPAASPAAAPAPVKAAAAGEVADLF